MNLHGIVSGAIGVVNPQIVGSILRSTGYTTSADGTQVPIYTTIGRVAMQVQALSSDELQHAEGMNLQGNKQAVYLNGTWNGVVRVGSEGGDILKFGGQTWLAVTVLENWPDWTKLMVVLQDGS